MSDTTCIYGRSFAKPFGLHIHQRTCPAERARSAAFIAAVEHTAVSQQATSEAKRD